MSTSLSGIAASNGIAFAKAFRLENPKLNVEKTTVENPEKEVSRLDAALAKSVAELEVIQQRTREQISDKEAAIFGAHLLVLSDPELIGPIKEKITNDKQN